MAIVVVDDDADVRDAVRAILEDEGHRTVGAASGEEALRVLEESDQLPCLILLDLMMPEMDGWQFLARIDGQADLHSIPVALMSAHPSVKRAFDKARPSDRSRHLLLPKPLSVLRLLSLVERVCGRPEPPS
jgi:CheY-like chemotaxis protein